MRPNIFTCAEQQSKHIIKQIIRFNASTKCIKDVILMAQEKLTLARYELQEVVTLLSKLITQIGEILTSKTDRLFDAFGINGS